MSIEQTYQKSDLVRVFVKGGMLSPADLRKIVVTAQSLGSPYIHFGSRQDILFPVRRPDRGLLHQTFEDINTLYDFGEEEQYQNIVSSFVAYDMLPSTPWVHADTYYYALSAFDYRPRVKINITDPAQALVPLFSGQINFVASPYDNYWYLFLRQPNTDPQLAGQDPQLIEWPELVYTLDMAKVAKQLEGVYLNSEDPQLANLVPAVQEATDYNARTKDQPLRLPSGPVPDYEGMNQMANGRHWLGLYWRNNCFEAEFMKAFCSQAIAQNISRVCISPWKSFLIKDITTANRPGWEVLMGKFGINMRHSSIEINWHLPVLNADALQLKRYLVKHFDQNDISTYGLSFTIKTQAMVTWTSVVIEQQRASQYSEQYELTPTYTVWHTREFNPNHSERVAYAQGVFREDLPAVLMNLSRHYFGQLTLAEAKPAPAKALQSSTPALQHVHQCSHCGTVYDDALGDPANGIEPGTPFVALPADYTCPLCDSPKADYQPVTLSLSVN